MDLSGNCFYIQIEGIFMAYSTAPLAERLCLELYFVEFHLYLC